MNSGWFSHEHARLLLEQSVKEAGGQRNWVKKHNIDINPAYVSLVLNRERPINPRMLKAFGLKKVTLYVPVDATVGVSIKDHEPSPQP